MNPKKHGGKRSNAGRPTLDHNKKAKPVSIMMTDKFHQYVIENAQHFGKSKSEFVRLCILNNTLNKI